MAWLWDKIKGFKTLATSAAVTVVGVANIAGGFDLRPLLAYFVRDEAQVGAILVVLGVVFAILRVVSTTPIGQAENLPTQVAPVKMVVDVGV